MKDPIDPKTDGYVLDVRRLRKLINDPSLHDDMEIRISSNSDIEDAVNVFMSRLEFTRISEEPNDVLVIALGATDFDMW